MAKIYLTYSAMNSGKSTALIQAAYNYQERGMRVLIFKPPFDTRDTPEAKVCSRIGLEANAFVIPEDVQALKDLLESYTLVTPPSAIFIDEVQFVSVEHLVVFADFCQRVDIPLLTYGLRNSYDGKGFPGSDWLLRHADKLVELKTICFCGKKATHNLMVIDGESVLDTLPAGNMVLGGNELYHAVCRKHFALGQFR